MSPKASTILALLFLLATSWPIIGQAKPPLRVAVMRQEFRNEHIKFEAVVDALQVDKGMTVLDIGAGPGYASFLFAKTLDGTGGVFATDIRKDFVDYIADEAQRRGMTNLFSAVVSDKGFDDFYSKNYYDIVLASNVYHRIDNPVEYFGKLRENLKPGARLVLIIYNQVPMVTVEDLSDIDSIVDILAEEDDNEPFFRNLSASTKALLAEKGEEKEIKIALVEDFNRMLGNPHFYKNFYDGSYFKLSGGAKETKDSSWGDIFTAPERELANWLLMTIKEDGILDKSLDQIDAKEMRSVIKLNRLFFKNRLGNYLANGGRGVYIPAGDANRHTSKYVMLRELAAAGYKFSKEIKSSPFYDTVIMVSIANQCPPRTGQTPRVLLDFAPTRLDPGAP